MEKKKIVFVTLSMVVGGVERSLLSALNLLSPDHFDITLVLFRKEGELLPSVPSHVNVVEMRLDSCDRYQLENNRKIALKSFVRNGHWIAAARMIVQRTIWNLGGRKRDFNLMVVESMMRRARRLSDCTTYDAAFSYAGWHLCNCYVRDVVVAGKKGTWCHNENELGNMAIADYVRLIASFDYRFATADLARRANQVIGSKRSTFSIMPYYLDPRLFRELSEKGQGFGGRCRGLRILTVGRLSPQKGIDVAVRIARRMKEKGFRFEWFVVGGGSNEYESEIRRLIKENGVEDVFKLVGEKLNPYPYIAQCDVYAQPSRWEAYCITVAEARAFAKPIIATDFIGAREQLKDGVTGFVVPLNDENAFARGLETLLLDANVRAALSRNLAKESVRQTDVAYAVWHQILPADM